MRVLTMVLRCGVEKTSNRDMLYTLVDEEYNIIRMTGDKVEKGILNNEFTVTNMGVTEKGLVATNGAINKYTLVNSMTGTISGQASPVILNRVEIDDKLAGYTIFNTDGILQEVNVQQAVALHEATPFSNGKLREIKGGHIISSIIGNYPLRKIKVPKEAVKKLSIDVVFVGSAIGKGNKIEKYMGIIINGDNAADITKVYNKVREDNRDLISRIIKLGGDTKIKQSLSMKMTGTAGFYGVYPINVVKDIKTKYAGDKMINSIGNIMVSTIDYSSDGEESRVTLTSDLKLVDKMNGTTRSDKVLKEYINEILPELKQVEIK